MAFLFLLGVVVFPGLGAPARAAAQPNGIIVRVNNRVVLQGVCVVLPCSIVEGMDGTLGQAFLVTPVGATPATTLLAELLGTVGRLLGVLDAELDQTLSLINLNIGPLSPPGALSQSSLVPYHGTSVWQGYASQPAVALIRLQTAQGSFNTGSGVVADIDTGVDPRQPAFGGTLLPGYDFTRNKNGGDETQDINGGQRLDVTSGATSEAQINESTAAVVNGGGSSVLSQPQYAGFGHGTMVSGIIHLVAPSARIMPLKAFGANGQAQLSNVLRAIYYGTQHGAKVLNMSFDLKTNSTELAKALSYASGQGVVSVASVGNDGKQVDVYPAGLASVMGIASTSDQDTLSSFSNYGEPPVWVGAPGEGIVSPYPYGTYASGWGTSFSAPFASGTVAVMLGVASSSLNQQTAAQAASNAVNIGDARVGHGRLDAYLAVLAWCQAAGKC